MFKLKKIKAAIKRFFKTEIKFRFIITYCLIPAVVAGALTLPSFAEKVEIKALDRLEIPRLEHPPKIDGKWDNPIWDQALRIDGFKQFVPKEGADPSHKTVAWLGYDAKNIYCAIKAYDSEPEKIRYSITTRDNCMEDDWVFLSLDTFNEKRRSYFLIINPLGIQMDMLRIEEGGNDNMDDSWDTVFYSDGKVTDDGYFIEMAIPFKSIRFPDDEEKVWSVCLGRTIARSGEIQMYPPMTKDKPGLISQAQEMVIRGKVEKGKNFELMPVATSLKTKGDNMTFNPGVNFKWGINSDMTLDMAANPDFSHIEADAPQIDVNQRFALYYNEKRPFFLEGMEIFRFPQIDMVYTRRINDPIAGAKLTGKTGRFTYGMLSALDTSPTESLWDVSSGSGGGDRNALYNIFRVKADVFKESYVGFSFTDKEMGGAWNRVAGLDGQFKFNDRWFLSFQAIGSKTRFGDQTTTTFAPAMYLDFSYFSKHLSVGAYGLSIHPDFEASSGYVNRTDYRSVGTYLGYRIYPEKKNLQQIGFRLNFGRRFGYADEVMQDQWVRASAQIRLSEFSQVDLEYSNQMERYGGMDFYRNSFEIQTQLMLLSWVTLAAAFETGESIYYDPDDPFKGYSNVYAIMAIFKPSRRIRLGVDFMKQTFWEKWGGEQVYDFNVVRTRTTYQLSKSLSVRGIVDYNHFYKEFYGSFLFRYQLRPGTVFFLGVDNNMLQNDFGRYASDSYSVFIKFSYWWRM